MYILRLLRRLVGWGPISFFKFGGSERYDCLNEKGPIKSIKHLVNDNWDFDNGSFVSIQNNVGITKYFDDKFVKEFDKMYSKRAFIHHYLRSGMEKGEFDEAREDIGFLQKDYLDIINGDDGDDEDDEDDDDDDY